MKVKKLKVPHNKQNRKSFCCSAYSLKSVCDFFKIKTTKNSLVQKCKVTAKEGANIVDTLECASSLGLDFEGIEVEDTKGFHREVRQSIDNNQPIIVSLALGDRYHACVLTGYDGMFYYFSDPLLGPNHKRHRGETRLLCRYGFRFFPKEA